MRKWTVVFGNVDVCHGQWQWCPLRHMFFKGHCHCCCHQHCISIYVAINSAVATYVAGDSAMASGIAGANASAVSIAIDITISTAIGIAMDNAISCPLQLQSHSP